ncbi:DUF4139 domain-containing protein [Pseudogemmobacter faecipullorum]|uniref:DUF4139 domain-containing protein n=1 Tax=Pseudogemmobacter faecipullorum TaxID=2755041 RepID=A0ABS8CGU6_9RHOB|nr:DUF4139 domain-containing protein [Pseudogemmobacter faecipullorum]MCB5408612.1 DUF4139 domain-containing protein [Pseudogemmobacter faecipullorum]
MRILLAALLATTALPAWADTISATSRITDVTVYPDGAKITREVRFTAPAAGSHELLVTDLPARTEAGMMQLAGGEGMAYGAFSLRADRLPPRGEALSPEQQAAKSELAAARADTAAALAAVEKTDARIRAAEAQITFLTSFSGGLPENAGPEQIRDLAGMIGSETLRAAEEVASARQARLPAVEALEEAQRAEAEAEAAFDSLPGLDRDYTALVVALEAAAAGDSTMTITHYISEAQWQPFYDISLSRGAAGKVTIDRSVLVTQNSGEDWTGVNLTLSSSRPSSQSAPSTLWPMARRIEKETPPEALLKRERLGAEAAADMVAMAPAPIMALAGMEGETVVYSYPRAVNIADGVEDLRLALGQIETAAEVIAVAVPSRDKTAFAQASFTNTSAEPLLPGAALLYREGVLVGSARLEMTAAGAETELAFGALESLRLTRDMPLRDQGQKGVFSTSNQLSETAILKIENLGSEAWPVRLLDQVPYSEQQDLKITHSASPAASEVDLKGQRGLMAWEFTLDAGASQEISLSYELSWPEGMVLR